MNKIERAAQFAEMQRLYFEEKLSLAAIGKIYGITRQAVRDRFVSKGIDLIKSRPHQINKIVDREALIQLYITEKRTIREILRQLDISERILIRELKRHGIEIRSFADLRTRYPPPLLNKLDIGEKMIVPFEQGRKDYGYIYKKAEQIGIKISVSRVDAEKLQVTRIK